MSEPEPSEAPHSSEMDESKAEYYRNKTLVTDEEVVAALIRDSKRRDGTLTPERIKPNLKFLQRTVSNVLSNNTRIDQGQDSFKTTYTEENAIEIKVLQEIRSEKKASTSRKPEYNFEKDLFLTNTINSEKSNEPYSTLKQCDLDKSTQDKAKIVSKTNTKKNTSETIITKDFLRKELEKINEKIEGKMTSKQSASASSNKKNKSKLHIVCSSTKNQVSLSKEEMLKRELAALNVKIQEKLSRIKTEDTVLILNKEDRDSDLEIVDLDSRDKDNSNNNDKTKTPNVKILQDIAIGKKTNSRDNIRSRISSRMKQNQLELSNDVSLISTDGTVNSTSKCGSSNSNAMDKKPCTAIKCETIELSSSNSSDIELVSVKIEPKPKKKKKKKKLKGRKKMKDASEKESRFSDREREERYDQQRENTYKTRKEGFRSTIRQRTKSKDNIRERTSSRERRGSFRERDKERSPSQDRRARSFSRFSNNESYERNIKEKDKSKSKSRSRSGSRDSRTRDSSTDSEQERYQAYIQAQQRFEERARREYWMNRIIREYQNRYRIPKIPQRHRLVDSERQEPPRVQSKVVVVPKKERDNSSGSDCSRSGASSSIEEDLLTYNLDTTSRDEVYENVEKPVADSLVISANVCDSSKNRKENRTLIKRDREASNNHSLEEGGISDKTVNEKSVKRKKLRKKES